MKNVAAKDVTSKSNAFFLAFFLFALLAALLLPACSFTGEGEDSFPRPIDFSTLAHDSTLLVGTWQWERTTIYGPGPPSNATPASTGQTERLVFEEDGTHEVYRNDTLRKRTTYDVERFCRESDGRCWLRLFRDGRAEMQWGVSNDTLAFSSVPLDGPEEVYTRAE